MSALGQLVSVVDERELVQADELIHYELDVVRADELHSMSLSPSGWSGVADEADAPSGSSVDEPKGCQPLYLYRFPLYLASMCIDSTARTWGS